MRLEITPEGSRVVARAFVGERELPPTPEILRALGSLCSGARDLPMDLLLEHGVFTQHDLGAVPPGPLALAGTTAVGLQLRPGTAQLTERGITRTIQVLPTDSLPIAGFVHPATLGPLSHLAEAIRGCWFQLLRAAHSRGLLVEPERATQLLMAVVDDRIAEDPALANLIEKRDGRYCPKVQLQQDSFAYPIYEVDLIDDRHPGLSTERFRFGVRPEEVATLGRVLGTYGRGCTAEELREAILEAPRLLGLAGGLVGTPMVHTKAEPVSLEPGCVAHLGHATLLANLGGIHIVIDPWLPAASRADTQRPLSTDQLPPLAAIFITHHHWDHVNLSTLLRLDKSIPVYVPAQNDAPLAPKTEALLRSIGFKQVAPLRPGDTIEIGVEGKVVAAPFTGEDPTDVGWNGLTWVLCHKDVAAWVHVDSGPDRFGNDTLQAAAELREQHGPLKPVFATRRQEKGTMVEHSWEFLFADPNAWARPTENCCNGADFLGALGRAAGGEITLYSEGGADWYPPATDFLRPDQPSALDAIQSYLWDDLDTIQAACPGLELSAPGDVWRIGGGRAGELTW